MSENLKKRSRRAGRKEVVASAGFSSGTRVDNIVDTSLQIDNLWRIQNDELFFILNTSGRVMGANV